MLKKSIPALRIQWKSDGKLLIVSFTIKNIKETQSLYMNHSVSGKKKERKKKCSRICLRTFSVKVVWANGEVYIVIEI